MPRVVLMAKSTYVWLDQLSRALRPRHPDARRHPGRGARHAGALGRHRAVADRPVGALEGVGADQADARQRRRGRLGLLARRLPRSPTTSAARPPTPTCATGPGRAASGSRATWCPTTWASTRAGSSSTRSGSCRCRSRPTRPTRSPARTCRPTRGSGSSSRTTTGTTATRRSSSSGSTARPATSATSTTATTARASRGTTRPSSTSSTPAVREQVIRTILDVARRFPIIRFDAAMVLAKKHIQRLWWPEPGAGGGIPSRAEHAMPEGRVRPRGCPSSSGARWSTASPPRSRARSCWPRRSGCSRATSSGRSGMHRVYNSAFMHMLRDEDGAGYRKVIKETIEFDPEILKRYVNFMSNPDEKTALEQFGKGDKYFGVATVLATLPGLPMLGPRPGPGLRREVRDGVPPGDARRAARSVARRAPRARDLPAPPPAGVVRRGARLPAVRPRDRRRARSTSTVLAYSNGSGRERSLVIYHDAVRVDERARSATPRRMRRKAADGSKRQVRRSLAEGLGLPNDAGRVRHLPRRADRPRIPPLVPRDLGARARGLARRLRDQRLLGVPRGLGRGRRAVGAARRAARRRRRPVARRRPARAPARAGPSARSGRSSPTA